MNIAENLLLRTVQNGNSSTTRPADDTRREFIIAIIGAGPAGLEALRALADAHGPARQKMTVYLFDDIAADQIGVGQAWKRVGGHADGVLLANMWGPSIVYRGKTRKIARALDGHADRFTADFPARAEVGEVLGEWGQNVLKKAAAQGLKIRFVRARVVDMVPIKNDRLEIVTNSSAGGGVCLVDAAVLTVGNEESGRYGYLAGNPGYVGAPWGNPGLAEIRKDATVAIAGTSLSAVDVSIVLKAEGHTGPIEMFSRSGLLPGVRGLHEPTTLRVLVPGQIKAVVRQQTGGAAFDLAALGALVTQEFAAQDIPVAGVTNRVLSMRTKAPREWLLEELWSVGERSKTFGLLKALDDVIAELWNELSLDAKRQWAKHLTAFAGIQWPMATPNGIKLYYMLEKGQVTVSRLEPGRGRKPDLSGGRFCIPRHDGSTLMADALIDVTGLGGKLEDFRDPLVQALRDRALAIADPVMGARVEFETGRLVDERDMPTAPIWAGASSLTRGSRLLTNELGEATRSAARAALAALEHLDELSHRN